MIAEELTMTVGEWVKAARDSNGWTQAQLGSILSVTDVTVSRWEKGDREPGFDMKRRIEEVTGFSLVHLIRRHSPAPPPATLPTPELEEPASDSSTPAGGVERPAWVEDLRASVTVVSERTEAAILDQKIGFIGEMVRIGEQLERRDARQEERDLRQEERDSQQVALLQGLMGVIDRNTSTIDDCRLESRETRKALEDLQRESRETREALARATDTIASLKARLEAQEVGPGDPVPDEQRDRGQWMGLRVQGRTHSEGAAQA